MAQIIGVRFQNAGKIYFFEAGDLDINVGEYVIVETVKGIEFAEVTMGKHSIEDQELKVPLKTVIRKANQQDISHSIENREHEKEAFVICQKKISEHNLEMKLVSAESAFDNSKLTFFFTANGRVDFRSLVKDLASVFKTRIELRQIGVRDEARMIGGLGPCGRQICCGAFLEDFEPVSIKMAKEQNLSLNPTKISGVCGRLMCCLKYEEEDYEKTRKRMPKIGKEVITPDGTGTVTDLNIVKETVKVRIAKGDSFEINEYELDKIVRPGIQNEENEKETALQENIAEHQQEESGTDHYFDDRDTYKAENPDALVTDNEEITQTDTPEISAGNIPEDKASERSKELRNHKDHKPALGQPVRREKKDRQNSGERGNISRQGSENTFNSRNQVQKRVQPGFQNVRTPEAKNIQNIPTEKPVVEEQSNVKASEKNTRSKWAEQLERAMAAADGKQD